MPHHPVPKDPIEALDNTLYLREPRHAIFVTGLESVSFAWLVEHAPDGTMHSMWNASRSPQALFCLSARYSPAECAVRAVSACVRRALEYALPLDLRGVRAMEIIEQWRADEAGDRNFADLAEQLGAASAQYWGGSAESWALGAAEQAVQSVRRDNRTRRYYGREAIENATRSLTSARENSETSGLSEERVVEILADIVREYMPCPDLGVVLDAIRSNPPSSG